MWSLLEGNGGAFDLCLLLALKKYLLFANVVLPLLPKKTQIKMIEWTLGTVKWIPSYIGNTWKTEKL